MAGLVRPSMSFWLKPARRRGCPRQARHDGEVVQYDEHALASLVPLARRHPQVLYLRAGNHCTSCKFSAICDFPPEDGHCCTNPRARRDKWTLLVIEGSTANANCAFPICRDGLQRHHKMLTKTLRQLERDGLVTRRVHAAVPPRVDYSYPARRAGRVCLRHLHVGRQAYVKVQRARRATTRKRSFELVERFEFESYARHSGRREAASRNP